MTRGDWYVSASGAYSRIHRHILEVEGIVYTAPCLPLLRSAGRLVAFAQVDDAQNNEEKHHDGIQAQHAKHDWEKQSHTAQIRHEVIGKAESCPTGRGSGVRGVVGDVTGWGNASAESVKLLSSCIRIDDGEQLDVRVSHCAGAVEIPKVIDGIHRTEKIVPE